MTIYPNLLIPFPWDFITLCFPLKPLVYFGHCGKAQGSSSCILGGLILPRPIRSTSVTCQGPQFPPILQALPVELRRTLILQALPVKSETTQRIASYRSNYLQRNPFRIPVSESPPIVPKAVSHNRPAFHCSVCPV